MPIVSKETPRPRSSNVTKTSQDRQYSGPRSRRNYANALAIVAVLFFACRTRPCEYDSNATICPMTDMATDLARADLVVEADQARPHDIASTCSTVGGPCCCDDGGCRCADGLQCNGAGSACEAPPDMACGGEGQPCCGGMCENSESCINGICACPTGHFNEAGTCS